MILKAENISKEFIRESSGTNRFCAVKNADIELKSGEFTILKGRSGSGKTTFLNILSGLLVPTEGKILLDDIDIYSLSDNELSKIRNEKIGVVPQGQTPIHSLDVIENIFLPCTLYGIKPDKKYAEELTERLGIAHLIKAMPRELSGGELKRMSIARSFIRRPGIILADEPTGDLDEENTEIVFEFLRENAKEGTAVLAVTHENTGINYSDRAFEMKNGIIEKI